MTSGCCNNNNLRHEAIRSTSAINSDGIDGIAITVGAMQRERERGWGWGEEIAADTQSDRAVMGVRDVTMLSRYSRRESRSNVCSKGREPPIAGVDLPTEKRPASWKVARALSYPTCQGQSVCMRSLSRALRDRGKRQKAEVAGRKCRRWLVTRFRHAFRARAARRSRSRYRHNVHVRVEWCHSCLLKACVRNDDGSPVRNIERSLDKARPSYTTVVCLDRRRSGDKKIRRDQR